ncbi:unnamed protein product [Owenia fusiformis]|nr:unnamed protein product [Owenia fusiformis]
MPEFTTLPMAPSVRIPRAKVYENNPVQSLLRQSQTLDSQFRRGERNGEKRVPTPYSIWKPGDIKPFLAEPSGTFPKSQQGNWMKAYMYPQTGSLVRTGCSETILSPSHDVTDSRKQELEESLSKEVQSMIFGTNLSPTNSELTTAQKEPIDKGVQVKPPMETQNSQPNDVKPTHNQVQRPTSLAVVKNYPMKSTLKVPPLVDQHPSRTSSERSERLYVARSQSRSADDSVFLPNDDPKNPYNNADVLQNLPYFYRYKARSLHKKQNKTCGEMCWEYTRNFCYFLRTCRFREGEQLKHLAPSRKGRDNVAFTFMMIVITFSLLSFFAGLIYFGITHSYMASTNERAAAKTVTITDTEILLDSGTNTSIDVCSSAQLMVRVILAQACSDVNIPDFNIAQQHYCSKLNAAISCIHKGMPGIIGFFCTLQDIRKAILERDYQIDINLDETQSDSKLKTNCWNATSDRRKRHNMN